MKFLFHVRDTSITRNFLSRRNTRMIRNDHDRYNMLDVENESATSQTRYVNWR